MAPPIMPPATQPRPPSVVAKVGEQNQRVVDYYRETADDYLTWSRDGYMHFGLWRRGISPFNRRAMLEAMNDLVFESLRLDAVTPAEVADLGCGIGAVSHYGSRVFPVHRWHAFTICPRQVAIGNRRFAGNNVLIRCADFNDLPMENGSLDAAFFLESLCHSSQLQRSLDEAARVLKPDGRLVVIDGMMRRLPHDTPGYVRRLSRAVETNWALGGFHCVPTFRKASMEAGFDVESCRELGWQVAPSVAHSPMLVGWHTLKLIATGRWSSWKRRHMVGCTLGILLGMLRRHFGYYLFSLRKNRF